ncbi:MAG: 4-oxalocrotonate decarboxylase [Pseudolabrys sp.]|jgi:2-oxo-3-hexenedioate decarboxylase|nr:4-oxalocrotonate decarboxylase [Pseudolabrys sp.]
MNKNMNTMAQLDVAAKLDEAARSATAIEQISLTTALSVPDAYRVQRLSVNLRVARGEKPSGMKLGLTSRAKMAQVGISTAVCGLLTDAMAVEEGHELPFARYIHPRAEPEIAFLLGKSLRGLGTIPEVARAVEAVLPAIEIIDSRYRNFKFSLADVIADNSSSSAYILGQPIPTRRAIDNVGMVLLIDGKPAEIGSSAAVLGSPWRALVAAAHFADEYDVDLGPGDIILSGGATAAVGLAAGQTVCLEVNGFAPIQFKVTA